MNKFLLLVMALTITSATFSQQTNKRIEGQIKDPKTKENSAKADVLIIDKKKVADSGMVKHVPPSTSPNTYKTSQSKKKKIKKSE